MSDFCRILGEMHLGQLSKIQLSVDIINSAFINNLVHILSQTLSVYFQITVQEGTSLISFDMVNLSSLEVCYFVFLPVII